MLLAPLNSCCGTLERKSLSVPFCQMGLPLLVYAVPCPGKPTYPSVERVWLCTCLIWRPNSSLILSKPQFTHPWQENGVSQCLLALQTSDFFFKGGGLSLHLHPSQTYIPPRNKKVDQRL